MRNLLERLLSRWLTNDPEADLVILEHAADVLVARGYNHAARMLLDVVEMEKAAVRRKARCASTVEMRKAPPAGVAP